MVPHQTIKPCGVVEVPWIEPEVAHSMLLHTNWICPVKAGSLQTEPEWHDYVDISSTCVGLMAATTVLIEEYLYNNTLSTPLKLWVDHCYHFLCRNCFLFNAPRRQRLLSYWERKCLKCLHHGVGWNILNNIFVCFWRLQLTWLQCYLRRWLNSLSCMCSCKTLIIQETAQHLNSHTLILQSPFSKSTQRTLHCMVLKTTIDYNGQPREGPVSVNN